MQQESLGGAGLNPVQMDLIATEVQPNPAEREGGNARLVINARRWFTVRFDSLGLPAPVCTAILGYLICAGVAVAAAVASAAAPGPVASTLFFGLLGVAALIAISSTVLAIFMTVHSRKDAPPGPPPPGPAGEKTTVLGASRPPKQRSAHRRKR